MIMMLMIIVIVDTSPQCRVNVDGWEQETPLLLARKLICRGSHGSKAEINVLCPSTKESWTFEIPYSSVPSEDDNDNDEG
mmetsp:Transcript_7822/g.7689  ORF Transcript_7822/g.7689 Transcript_7822/m.7689 type:complete len:80 (-) Transcript_7822:984-1223(-)